MKERIVFSNKMIIVLFTALFLFSLSLNTVTVTSSINENTTSEPSILTLTPHDPIEITSDSDLEVFPGLGTAEDPHIIEDYIITTAIDKGIFITGTTKHFIVCNCYINVSTYGIYIYNVADGTASVINNSCNNNAWGISLAYSSSSTVSNNTCNNNYYYGIHLQLSDFCVVTYNLLQENKDYGVSLFHSCDNNLIHHNTFVDNNLGGSSQAGDDGKKNKWYDSKTKEGNYWSDLSSNCKYKIGDSYDIYPLNRDQSCPNPMTMTILSIVLSLLVSVAILTFVVPKYIIPYTRKTIIPRFVTLWSEKKTRRRKK